jgi:transketolase
VSDFSLPMGPATRDAYGAALIELGKRDPRVVVLDADLSKSTKSAGFGKAFPDRFFNVGIAEANMIGVASGLAACGKIPFASSFASFLICKGYDQARMGVAYSRLPVRLVGSHGGITLGEDGVSQMAIEDIALTVSLPEFTVVVPADEYSTNQIVLQLADYPGPVFMRTGRSKTPHVYTDGEFTIGRGNVAVEGSDVAIIACGIMVAEAVYAADLLKKEGISAAVIDMHTIKPLDVDLIEKYARKCGAIVTAEEHQIWGGLGAAVCQAVAQRSPVPVEQVAVMDTYAKSGTPDAVKAAYGLTIKEVAAAARKVVARKF